MANNSAPKLPIPGAKNILVTSALPYVNNVPHLGNIIGCVLSADVYARYCRGRGHNVIYICGTDEYGTATENKAIDEGVTPQQICDKYHAIHAQIYQWFGIKFDHFGRTSTPQQTEIAHDIFNRLHARNLLLEESVEQLYCEKCARFLADRFVEGECPHCKYNDARGDQCDQCGKLLNPTELNKPRCKRDGSTPIIKNTEHMFLDLPRLTDDLQTWFESASETGAWSSNSTHVTKSWMRDGLKPRCITRDLKWGTPVPLEKYKDKVFYVWFDAPIGYLSITACYTPEWAQWWKNPKDVKLVQFMGKDNIPFHTVIFPASLIGTADGYTLLHHISTTEYLLYEGGKFSKSRNTGVFGDDAQSSGIPPEIWRFYLLATRPELSDSVFTWKDLQLKCNSELLAVVGNFANRILKFCQDFLGGQLPAISQPYRKEELDLLRNVNVHLAEYIAALDAVHIRDGLKAAMEVARVGNRYLQETKPWELIKTDAATCGLVISATANVVLLLASLFEPFMPQFAAKLLEQLQVDLAPIVDEFTFTLPADHQIGQAEPIVSRITDAQVEEYRIRYGGEEALAAPFPLDLRLGQVVSAAEHPEAPTLLVLQVEVGRGEPQRQLVAGIRAAYSAESVVGRSVVLLCNIKPAVIKGVNSDGMVLVADDGKGGIGLLTLPPGVSVPAGTSVLPARHKFENKLLINNTRKEFAKCRLVVGKDLRATCLDPAVPLLCAVRGNCDDAASDSQPIAIVAENVTPGAGIR